METVIEDNVFGNVVTHARVVEFHIRGNPHTHCIFNLDQASKNALRNPARVNAVAFAMMPPEDDNALRKLVLQHMIHNPCSSHNPIAVRMGDRGWKKAVPKAFL